MRVGAERGDEEARGEAGGGEEERGGEEDGIEGGEDVEEVKALEALSSKEEANEEVGETERTSCVFLISRSIGPC